MNQILVADKIYVTPEVKKKRKRYKRIFSVSLVLVVIFFSYYVYSESERSKSEAISQDILEEISFGFGDTTVQEDTLVISLNEGEGDTTEEFEDIAMKASSNTYTSENGTVYTVDSILTIPKIDITYPVLSETSDELLKISLNKFWGIGPNQVGNYCIVGHNYKSGKMFGKLSKLEVGDTIQLQDSSGKTLTYAVYNKYIVYPTDVSCTSQLTNGKKEVTLITCINSGTQRLIVRCREVK